MVHLIAVDLPSLYVHRYEVDERLYGATKAKCRSGEAWTKIIIALMPLAVPRGAILSPILHHSSIPSEGANSAIGSQAGKP
jgi:hypothetical protein